MVACLSSGITIELGRQPRVAARACLAVLLVLAFGVQSCHRGWRQKAKELHCSVMWQAHGPMGARAYDAFADPAGEIVVVGSQELPDGNRDVYALRVSPETGILWAKSFDLGGRDRGASVIRGWGDEFVLACNSWDAPAPAGSVVLLGVDMDGGETFRVRPRFSKGCVGVAALAAVTADEWIVVGWSSERECSCRMWAADVSREGSIVWEQDFQIETCEFQVFTDIVDIGNGLYMGVGWADMPRARGARNVCIVKFGADGRELDRYVFEKPLMQQPLSVALLRDRSVVMIASWCVWKVEVLGVDFSGAVVFEGSLDFPCMHARISCVDNQGCLLAFSREVQRNSGDLDLGVAQLTTRGIPWWLRLGLAGTYFPICAAWAGRDSIVLVGNEWMEGAPSDDYSRRLFVARVGNLRERE